MLFHSLLSWSVCVCVCVCECVCARKGECVYGLVECAVDYEDDRHEDDRHDGRTSCHSLFCVIYPIS